jgi:hypothetical protein
MRKMPTVRNLKPTQKALAMKGLPVFQALVLITGLAITVYLNGTQQWLSHSISYLAVAGRCVLPFGATLFSAALLGYTFLVVSMWILFEEDSIWGTSLSKRLPPILFTIAYAGLALAALIPTSENNESWNHIAHVAGAYTFFLVFPAGMLAFSLLLNGRLSYLKKYTFWCFAIYVVSTIGLYFLSVSLVVVEVVGVIVIGLWSILLARVVAGEILNRGNAKK